MAINVNRAYEIDNNGLLIEKADGTDGVWFGGDDAVPTHAATIGSIYLRTNGDWYKQEGPGTTDWAIFTGGGGGSSLDAYFSWSSDSQRYLKGSDSNYQTIATGPAFGTGDEVLVNIEVIARLAGGSGTFSMRIIDVDNANVIAEGTGFSGVIFDAKDLGTISNQPTGDWTWELQVKNTGDEWQVSGMRLKV